MRENIINSVKYLTIQAMPILIVYLLYEVGFSCLRSSLGNISANLVSTSLAAIYLVIVTAIGYFNKLSWVFLIISQIAVFLCGVNNGYCILSGWINNFSGPFSFEGLFNFMMSDYWYKPLGYFTWLVILPIGLPFTSMRIMLKRPKNSNDSLKNSFKKNISKSFGSARFFPNKKIKSLHNKEGVPVGCLLDREVNTFDDIKNSIYKTKCKKSNIIKFDVNHLTVVARTGAGKGVGIIVPTLLEYQGPVFVFDINHGENYSICARRRKEMGRKVWLLDPYKRFENEGLNFNLLELLNQKDEEVVEDVMVYSKLLCPVVSTTENSHFDQFGAALIQCFILYVAFSEHFNEERNLGSVYDLVCKTRAELYGSGKDEDNFKLEQIALKNKENNSAIGILHVIANDDTLLFGRARNIARKVLGTTYREASGYFTTAFRELEFLDSPKMRKHLSTNELDPNELVTGNVDLFAILPSERISTQSRYMRLITGVIFHYVQKAGGMKGKHDLLMVLDEFSVMGYMESLSKGIAFLRKYKVKFMGIVQDIETVREAYPRQWGKFLSTELLIFFGTNGHEECELVSNKLGQGTICVESKNEGDSIQKRNSNFIDSSTSSQTGMSTSSSGRSLLFPDEVRRLGDETIIALLVGCEPIILKRLTYYKYKFWKGMYDPNPFYRK